jgi:hypothetical protein
MKKGRKQKRRQKPVVKVTGAPGSLQTYRLNVLSIKERGYGAVSTGATM